MTARRWFAALVVLAGLMVLGGANLAVTAQDKGKRVGTNKDETNLVWRAFEPKAVFYQEWVTKTTQHLVWRAFEVKAVFYQELDIKTKQQMTIKGQKIDQDQSQTFYFKWTADGKQDGNYIVTLRILGFKWNANISGSTMNYDSTDPNQPPNPMAGVFRALLGLELKLTVSPKMEVIRIEGREEFVKKVGPAGPQQEAFMKNILTPDTLKQIAEITWGALPESKVATADSWKKKDGGFDLGPLGKCRAAFTYTYEGKDDKNLDRIGIKSELNYTTPDMKNGQPFTIEKAIVRSKEASGSAYFDRAKGRFVETTVQMKLEADLTTQVGGMDTKIALIHSQDTISKTLDDPPSVLTAKKKP